MIKFVNILNNPLINYNFTIFGEKSFKFQFYYAKSQTSQIANLFAHFLCIFLTYSNQNVLPNT